MTDDVEKFNAYPWGRLSFDVLFGSIKKVRTTFQNRVSTYDSHGCMYALIAWACKTFSALLINEHASLKEATTIPRMLRWNYMSEKKSNFTKLSLDVFENNQDEMIMVTGEQAQQPEMSTQQLVAERSNENDQNKMTQVSGEICQPPLMSIKQIATGIIKEEGEKTKKIDELPRQRDMSQKVEIVDIIKVDIKESSPKTSTTQQPLRS